MTTYDFLGIFVPALLLKALAAGLLTLLLVRILAHLGVYRFVWHPALLNIALYVILLGLISVPARYWWFLT